MNTQNVTIETSFMDSIYFSGIDFRAEYDMGFSYFMMDMDREAFNVMARLMNSEDELAELYALQLMALYNN